MASKKKEEELSELSVDELIQKRNEVLELLQTLEDEHRTASISDESYKSAKAANQKKLEQMRAILAEFGIGDSDGKPPEKKKDGEPPPAESAPPSDSSGKPPEATEAGQKPAAESAPSPEAAPAQSGQAQPPQASAVAPPAPSSRPAPPDESQIIGKMDAKLKSEIEKLQILIDSLKEGRTASDERVQRLTESIGEIRSMFYNLDNEVKSGGSKLEFLEEGMAGLDPAKVEKEFSRRDKSIGASELRIEKLERKAQDTTSTIKELQDILTSVGGLHNIADIDHEVTKKLEEIRETHKQIKRVTERAEKSFVDLNKRMDEFFIYRAKQETLDEIVRDVIASIDTVNSRLDNTVGKSYVKDLRDSFKGLEGEISKINSKIATALPFAEFAIPKEAQELSDERESIKLILSSLDEEARKGKISKEECMRAKTENEKKLAEVEEKIRTSLQNSASPSVPATPGTTSVEKAPGQKSAPEENTAPGAPPVPETGESPKGDSKATDPEDGPGAEKPEGDEDAGKKSKDEPAEGEGTGPEKEALSDAVFGGGKAQESPENKEGDIPAPGDVAAETAAKHSKKNAPAPAKKTSDSVEKPADEPAAEEEAAPSGEPAKPAGRKEKLLSDLEDSFKKGHLSKKAYEHSRELVMKITG